MPANSRQYYRTEQEIAKLMKGSGLPIEFTNPFTRDYAAVKGDIAQSGGDIEAVQKEVDQLELRVAVTESDIGSLNSNVDSLNTSVFNLTLQVADIDDRLIVVEDDLGDLTTDFNIHTADQSAHGATGDIVGTDDYCTALVGGTVLLASALAANASSTLSITSIPASAAVAYNQGDATTWVNAINEIKADFNALIVEYNLLVTKVNDIIDTQKVAKQRSV